MESTTITRTVSIIQNNVVIAAIEAPMKGGTQEVMDFKRAYSELPNSLVVDWIASNSTFELESTGGLQEVNIIDATIYEYGQGGHYVTTHFVHEASSRTATKFDLQKFAAKQKEGKTMRLEKLLAQAINEANNLFWAIAAGEDRDNLITRTDEMLGTLVTIARNYKDEPLTAKEQTARELSQIRSDEAKVGIFYTDRQFAEFIGTPDDYTDAELDMLIARYDEDHQEDQFAEDYEDVDVPF